MVRVARSPGNGGLSGHSIGLVIGGKVGVSRVAGSSGDSSLCGHSV